MSCILPASLTNNRSRSFVQNLVFKYFHSTSYIILCIQYPNHHGNTLLPNNPDPFMVHICRKGLFMALFMTYVEVGVTDGGRLAPVADGRGSYNTR